MRVLRINDFQNDQSPNPINVANVCNPISTDLLAHSTIRFTIYFKLHLNSHLYTP